MGVKCVVCGKSAEGKLFQKGKFFCCSTCLKKYKDKNKSNKKAKVCEFC